MPSLAVTPAAKASPPAPPDRGADYVYLLFYLFLWQVRVTRRSSADGRSPRACSRRSRSSPRTSRRRGSTPCSASGGCLRPPPSLPYKVDTSRPSLRTNWTRLVHNDDTRPLTCAKRSLGAALQNPSRAPGRPPRRSPALRQPRGVRGPPPARRAAASLAPARRPSETILEGIVFAAGALPHPPPAPPRP